MICRPTTLPLIALVITGCATVLGIDEPAPRNSDGSANGGIGGGDSMSNGGQAGERAGVGGEGPNFGGAAGNDNGGAAGTAGAAGVSDLGGSGGADGGAGQGGGGQGGSAGNEKVGCGSDCGSCQLGVCNDCSDGDVRCVNDVAQQCAKGSWTRGTLCRNYCLKGACINPPSCTADEATCQGGISCCKAYEVPGGAFKRSYDDVDFLDDGYPATVSPFVLDKFEVTVSRMRHFVTDYSPQQFKSGDGKSIHFSADPGWQTQYPLPATSTELTQMLNCTGTTWTDEANQGQGTLPISCVNFFIAYAFCIWDGGRLPSEAEWNFAASGGDEQRFYPWSVPPMNPAIDSTYATFEALEARLVGLTPKGDARWGHSDLAGNLVEWTLDYYYDDYQSNVCDDCIDVRPGDDVRVLRGGYYFADRYFSKAAYRDSSSSSTSSPYAGFRCAYDIH